MDYKPMMCLTEYDEEATMRAFRREGYEDGYTEGKQEAARKLIELNTMSVEQIAYVTELPIEQIRGLQRQIATKE